MGCIESGHEDLSFEPIWATNNKGYDEDELTKALYYIDQTILWLDSLDTTSDDVVMLRVGCPYRGTDVSVDAQTIYEDGSTSTDRVVKTIGVDAIKVTTMQDQYTYKSPYIHRIYDGIFIEGIDNRTSSTDIDSWSTSLKAYDFVGDGSDMRDITYSVLASSYTIPIVREGKKQYYSDRVDVPSYVLSAVTYIAQNPSMTARMYESKWYAYSEYNVKIDDTLYATEADALASSEDVAYALPQQREPAGDIVIIPIDKFVARLKVISSKGISKLSHLSTEYQESIKYLLEGFSLDQAFDSIQYGGDIDDMRLVLKIPASRENQDVLERLIHKDDIKYPGLTRAEIFKKVLPTKFEYVSEKDFNESTTKKAHLCDPYSSNMEGKDYVTMFADTKDVVSLDSKYNTEYDLLDPYDGMYGCKNVVYTESTTDNDGNTVPGYTTITYRYFEIDAEWLRSLSPQEIAIVFTMGLDLDTVMKNVCEFDTLITIIIIVVATYFGCTGCSTWLWAMAIAGAAISIGVVTGAFGNGKRARNAQIVAALLSLGSSYASFMSKAATTTSVVAFAISIANTVLQVQASVDAYKFTSTMEARQKELDDTTEDAELYESKFRFMYGDSYEYALRECERDPYEEVASQYDEFSNYGYMDGIL